jgi:tRNA dimethylallyltransferase
MAKQKVLILVGPTSSGKSALAVQLAKKFNGEVISADSRQVYRGLDIGTGKIARREMQGVPHHLLDVASPKNVCTAHDFVQHARDAISDIAARGKLPIVAGGTGFYIDALVGRITLAEAPADKQLRARLEKKTAAQLYADLQQNDPRRAKTIDGHNKRRLIRALEIVAALGTAPRNLGLRNPNFELLWIGLDVPKAELDKKISTRLFARIRQGMVAEAQRLRASGLSYKRMETLGLEYRSLARLLQKKITREECISELDLAIRKYAKRQRTYWRRNDDILWFKPSQTAGIKKEIRAWLGKDF